MIVDCQSGYHQTNLRGKETCHEITNHRITWLESQEQQHQAQHIADYIVARLLFIFVDVVCIFADDCGGLDEVVDLLVAWTSLGIATTFPEVVRPRLIVVTNISGANFASEALQFRLRVLSDSNFQDTFSSLKVINILGARRFVSKQHFSGLTEVLQNELQSMQNAKSNSQTSFSMSHIAAFFDIALSQFASKLQPFDFVQASRADRPVSSTFTHHLSTFIRLCQKENVPCNAIWKFVASAIVLDSFPPDMHMFNPSVVFRCLYVQYCKLGLQEYITTNVLSADLVTAEIEAHMISMFSQMKYGAIPASALHTETLLHHKMYLSSLRHQITCLICLQRNVEHHLACGHSICEECVVIYGSPLGGMEYTYNLDECPRCEQKLSFQAKHLPPTCRVRFLSFDGGGSRGIVSLAFMEELQSALDLPYPIQEHFDYAIGTSGVATIGLFAKYWTPKQCLVFFQKFARIIFPPRRRFRFPLCTMLRRIFEFYFADGRYDATVLERALQDAFGSDDLLGCNGSHLSRIKFAVTATTISDATLCLISNYNGLATLHKDLRYKHLRADNPENEISLWEAARCTTAAPTYFKPKHLKSFGALQDGGLKYNNPVRPGLREVGRIWGDTGCDLVLSVGTGFQQKLLSPVATNVRNLLQDGALARIYRASMQSLSLNGQISWEDHWFGLDQDAKKQHFRLNLPLLGQEPSIDDVDQMQYLHDQIQHHLGDMEGIVRAFKAVNFFFELDAPLLFEHGHYTCYGSILTRSPNSRALVDNLLLSYPFAQFLLEESPIALLKHSHVCGDCGRFQLLFKFRIRHPSDRVNIQFAFNRLFRRSISGFPQSIEWFIYRQKLDAKFGLTDHRGGLHQGKDKGCTCRLKRYHERFPSIQKRELEEVNEMVARKKRCSRKDCII